MKTKVVTLFLLCFGMQTAIAQSDTLPAKNPGTFLVQIKQDNALGFYPGVFGSLGINPDLDFTFYAVFWTNPTFGTASAGTNLWTETGIGLGLPALDGSLYFNPSLGFTHGNLQSGNAQGVIGEGVAPSLLILYLEDRFEAEGFFIYYKNLRSDNPNPVDYIIYWLYPGIR
ncbi:MAG: hypothetical protein KDC44_11820, partial [Phaeodactylibacter sp.]|nr:hypothetical protein [Phaeodactylibacter sp.]